jgi:tetratricopeptide (TPR) repeat protein
LPTRLVQEAPISQPNTPEDIFNRASTELRSGNSEQGASIALEGLEQYPRDPHLLCLAGRALISLKRPEEAVAHIKKALKLHPEFSWGHVTDGDLELIAGRPAEAVKSYRKAQKLGADRAGVQEKIDRARVMLKAGKPTDGKRRSGMAFPEEIARAAQLERDGKPEEAENIYRDILSRDPDHVEAIRLLAASASVHHRKYSDAETLLSRATELAPDYPRAWADLTAAQIALAKFPEAVASARTLVDLDPQFTESYIALGNALGAANKPEDAIEAYQTALKLQSNHVGAFSGLAQQLKTVGRQEEAIEAHRQNIAANPRHAEPYWQLANLKVFQFSDQEIEDMETLLKDTELEDLARAQLHNAVGLGYEHKKNYRKAFKNFQLCNEIRRKSEKYDPVQTEVTTDNLIEVFSREFLEETAGYGVSDASPILIVGLPRSGSTLIEQILASHSQVEGTHELNDLAKVVAAIPKSNQARFPLNLPALGSKAWGKIGNQYLERTLSYRSGSPHFTDKNPNNFIYAGLLRLALPNAKIINARRHPLDSCFGSYKQLFAEGQPFTYDLTELGEYYLQYQRLMDHWHEVMPGAVLDVEYEDVIGDLETQVRRLLDYCGLPFEEACLNFHQTERSVKTASSEQVRQPIYSSSVNLWKNYAPYLSELIEVLGPLLHEDEASPEAQG